MNLYFRTKIDRLFVNFLAHVYLSFGRDDIAIGNFIADSIRGNKFNHFEPGIRRGIKLHRAIDTFTDTHPIPRISSKRLHKHYSHYSRVIVDIYYDHFLARNWERYSDVPLERFVEDFYDLLEVNFSVLPDPVKRMIPYMMADNWLLSYAELSGIARVLKGMNRRTRNRSKMNLAIVDLEEHYSAFEDEFTVFFEDLVSYAQNELKAIEKQF